MEPNETADSSHRLAIGDARHPITSISELGARSLLKGARRVLGAAQTITIHTPVGEAEDERY